jgi:uncharacterized protein YggE
MDGLRTANVEGSATINVPCDRLKIAVAVKETDTSLERANAFVKASLEDFVSLAEEKKFNCKIQWEDAEIERLTEHAYKSQNRREAKENTYRVTRAVVFDMAWDVEAISALIFLIKSVDEVEIGETRCYLSDAAPYAKQATEDAVKKAKDYAETICHAAGAKLGPLIGVNMPTDRRGFRSNVYEEPELCVEDLLVSIDEAEDRDDPLSHKKANATWDNTITVISESLLKKRGYVKISETISLQFAIID